MRYFLNIIICIIDRYNNNLEMGKINVILSIRRKFFGEYGILVGFIL